MAPRVTLGAALLLIAPPCAVPPDLAFESKGGGVYEFDTGVLRGRLKAEGRSQGLHPLVDVATGFELTDAPGVFSLYRVFAANRRFGDAARDWPTRSRLRADGAVEVVWPSADEHPLEMTAVYRWSTPDALDLEIAVRPDVDLPGFELFVSSYFAKGFRASVQVQGGDSDVPHFVPVDRRPDSRGGYVMFPRDESALDLIEDGRWKIPPSPVAWAIRRWLATPLAMRRDKDRGLTALMMSRPGDCFAISSPWNPASIDAGGYRSLYLSLFGRNLAAGQRACARCRLIVRRKLSEEGAMRCYREWAKPGPPRQVTEERVRALRSLRWGMFVCWSFSTFSGKEWTPGVKDVSFFRATEVDTDQWARTAKEAEMGYILFLAKHHDGFCLWDTDTTDRKVTKAPLGRDVLAELKASCDKHGIKLALYFSEGDWTWPGAVDGKGGRAGGGANPEVKKAQLKELLTRYGPIEFIWFDHAVGTGGLSHKETAAFVKSLQPGCFVGFNHGEQEVADIRLGERGRPGPLSDRSAAGPHMRDEPSRSYRVAEFTYPILPPHRGGAAWFYSLPKHDDLVHPPAKLYRDYLGAKSYGNLFSIDVGPDYEGRLRDIDVKTLRTVGRWIRGEEEPEEPPLSFMKPARASTVWKDQARHAADKAFDGDPETRWGAAENARSGWLEVDLGESVAVSRAVIVEGTWNRVEEFQVQAEIEGDWRTLASGDKLGERKEVRFEPTRARRFRLLISKASEVPTIHEFELYRD